MLGFFSHSHIFTLSLSAPFVSSYTAHTIVLNINTLLSFILLFLFFVLTGSSVITSANFSEVSA